MAKASSTQPVPTPAPRIIIIRKAASTKVPKLTKARLALVTEALSTTRVQRPELLEFFLSGEFDASEALPQSVIDNPARRKAEFPHVGWTVPEGSLGRPPKNGERDWQSTSQSILLWIKRTLVETGWLRIEDLSIIVERD